jgi:hypothetical protein
MAHSVPKIWSVLSVPSLQLTLVANLMPVSLTQVANFATGINDTSGIGGQFAAGVVDTGGKFANVVVYTGSKFAIGVIDTGGKFAAYVVDTSGAP